MKSLVPLRRTVSVTLTQARANIRKFGFWALLSCAPGLHAQTLNSVYLYRATQNVQTDATTVGLASGNPYSWGVEVKGTGLAAPVITLPTATNNGTINPTQHNGGTLGYNSSDGAWEYGSPNFNNISFSTSTDRNTRFPAGAYTVAISGLTTVSLTYNLITVDNIQFTLTNGTGGYWSGGNYYFDPTQSLTISSASTPFSYFTSGSFQSGQVNAAIRFAIYDSGANPISGSSSTRFQSDTTPGNNYISYTVAANTLAAGSTFKAVGNYVAISDQNTTNSASNMAFFNGATSVTLIAIPEPSTYAAIVGACGLGLALWRRRRQA